MNNRHLILALTLLMAQGLARQAVSGDAEPIYVVVSTSSSIAKIEKDELRQIFQTTKTTWSNGETVTPINLPDDDRVRHAFDHAVLGLEPERVARYWMDRKIRGDARPPRKVGSPSAVIRTVAKNQGFVGYVPASEASRDVKIIAKISNGKVVAP